MWRCRRTQDKGNGASSPTVDSSPAIGAAASSRRSFRSSGCASPSLAVMAFCLLPTKRRRAWTRREADRRGRRARRICRSSARHCAHRCFSRRPDRSLRLLLPGAEFAALGGRACIVHGGAVAERDRRLLLSGRSAEGVAETGPIVCAGFGVGLEAIRGAITLGTAATVAEIGKALRAGMNCGSCMPELHGVVERTAAAAARNDG